MSEYATVDCEGEALALVLGPCSDALESHMQSPIELKPRNHPMECIATFVTNASQILQHVVAEQSVLTPLVTLFAFHEDDLCSFGQSIHSICTVQCALFLDSSITACR